MYKKNNYFGETSEQSEESDIRSLTHSEHDLARS